MISTDKLAALGFDFVGGMVDRNGVNYGHLTPEGVVLNEAGEELVAALTKKPRRMKDSDVAAVVREALESEQLGG